MNSRLDESVSDLYRAKIRLGEFRAVYSIPIINPDIYGANVTGTLTADLFLSTL